MASFSSNSFVCAANVDDEHSVVRCKAVHPSSAHAAARYTAAMTCWPTEAFFV